MKTITITGGNITTHKLTLSDNGHTRARKGERIRWKVKNSADPVETIEDVFLKGNTKDIFSGQNGNHPAAEDSKNWKADIAEDVQIGDICEYSIKWKDKDGESHTHDPKISINPSFAPPLVIGVVVLGVLALSYLFYRRFRRSK